MRKYSVLIMFAGIALLSVIATSSFAEGNARGIDLKNFDTTVSPCQDFYLYVNGNWMKNNPIPPAYSSWAVSDEMRDRNEKMLRTIIEAAAANTNAPKGTNLQKIGDFYAVANDSVSIEKNGIAPLKNMFDRINAVASVADLAKLIGQFHSEGFGVVFSCGSEQDLKNNTQIIAYATQDGLGLPDRDYYTKTDDQSKILREKYVAHVSAMLQLLGDSPEKATAEAQAIMAMETKLAEASLTNVEQRDPNTYYNLVSVKDADKAMPNFSWTNYFQIIGYPQITQFSYAHPKFFAQMDTLLVKTPISDWKSYLRWNVVHQYAPYLNSSIVNENFNFYAKTLAGQEVLRPRWKRAITNINYYLGEALGQLYVEKAFPPSYKARAKEMVQNLAIALGERIKNLPWMSDTTKQLALKKLSTFSMKIGYPDKWIDYSKLTIDRGSYVANVQRSIAFEYRRQMDKIGKPVDKTEWGMSPQTINAEYNPLLNAICFPAAILQPPLFDGEMDDAVNYGAMGSIIGHEMSHGYDDQGSQFDFEGNLKNWWADADLKEFKKRSEVLVKQFDAYPVVDSVHVNGELTLGENIGDLGGLLISYDALQKALAGKERKLIDGFTPEQRFFISFAQEWRENIRPKAAELQVNTDVHAPARNRLFGTLQNMPAFFKAFGCKDGDAQVRPDSMIVRIW
jgi:putative endopeptidase